MGAVDYWFIRHAATLIRSPAAIEVIAVTAASRKLGCDTAGVRKRTLTRRHDEHRFAGRERKVRALYHPCVDAMPAFTTLQFQSGGRFLRV